MREELSDWLAQHGAVEALETLSSLVPDAGVFVVDRERNIIHWSEGAERLLDLTPEEVLGQNCRKANRCHQCMMGCGIAKYGTVRDIPLVLYRSKGEAVRVRKSGRAFFDDNGEFAGGIEVLVPDAHLEETSKQSEDAPGSVSFHGLMSADAAMHAVFRTCASVSSTDSSVFLHGESGSGKELLSRAIHDASRRRDKPFVAINCAALTPSLMESELFGHVRGAFTGAIEHREGIFRMAHGGTLFLDEVAELPLDMQAKLLRVLEDGMVIPVGGTRSYKVDVRIISATHRSLPERVAQGRFREDLMFRLHVVPINIPPLRERRSDIQYLLWRFIGEKNRQGGRIVDHVAPDAMRTLLDHRWPGNVRELRNVVEYAFAVGGGPELTRAELPPELRGERRTTPAPAVRVHSESTDPNGEANRIARALKDADGHLGNAADSLGMSRPTLWRKRKKYGL